MQPYHFNDFKKRSVIFDFKCTPSKRGGVDCDVIIKTVNAHLTVRKYCRLTNEITAYKIVALECSILAKVTQVSNVAHGPLHLILNKKSLKALL
jgi:hypothetical protein